MLPRVLSTVIKIAVLSLIVGLLMSVFGVRPLEVLSATGSALRDLVDWLKWGVGWAWKYIVLGAAIVVPLWLLLFAFRTLRR
jgi:hypothetical protein